MVHSGVWGEGKAGEGRILSGHGCVFGITVPASWHVSVSRVKGESRGGAGGMKVSGRGGCLE